MNFRTLFENWAEKNNLQQRYMVSTYHRSKCILCIILIMTFNYPVIFQNYHLMKNQKRVWTSRGKRGLHAWLSWRTFRAHVNPHMLHFALRYNLFLSAMIKSAVHHVRLSIELSFRCESMQYQNFMFNLIIEVP